MIYFLQVTVQSDSRGTKNEARFYSWAVFSHLLWVCVTLISCTGAFLRPRAMHFRFYCTKRYHPCADGELRFASYYGDHMVLQKSPEKAVLWGYGPEGVAITVCLSGPTQQTRSAETVKDGEYTGVTMKPRKPSRHGHETNWDAVAWL